MMWTDQRLRVLMRAAALLAVFVVGGVLGATLLGPGSVEAAHPCQEAECEGWWIFRDCEANTGQLTHCQGTGKECVTAACGHR